jgi:hypothetical protein
MLEGTDSQFYLKSLITKTCLSIVIPAYNEEEVLTSVSQTSLWRAGLHVDRCRDCLREGW